MSQAGWRTLAAGTESRIVGLTAAVEGFVLIIFPAASAIITDTRHYGMAGPRYGELVVPELVTAILASLTGFGLARRQTSRLAYRLGLGLGLAAMVLFLISSMAERDHPVSYPLLLAASACIGAGFGVTVPLLFAYARFLHACAEDMSMLAINALIAVGALIAPVAAALFVHFGMWRGLPALSAVLLIALLLRSGCLPPHAGAPLRPMRQAFRCTVRFLFYAVFAMGYAVCAAVIVIWSQLRAASPPGPITQAQLTAAVQLAQTGPGLHTSLAFATFWGATLAAGRVMFAAVDRWQSAQARAGGYLVPIAVLGALIAVGVVSHHLGLATLTVFVAAGLGCSALLPLNISFTQKDVTAISAALAGGVIAYQLGYGIVAMGLRPPASDGTSALPVFAAAALAGLVLSGLAFAVVRGRPGLADWDASASPGRPH